MEEFLKTYGFLILMLVVCVGSHFFMHGSKRHQNHSKKFKYP